MSHAPTQFPPYRYQPPFQHAPPGDEDPPHMIWTMDGQFVARCREADQARLLVALANEHGRLFAALADLQDFASSGTSEEIRAAVDAATPVLAEARQTLELSRGSGSVVSWTDAQNIVAMHDRATEIDGRASEAARKGLPAREAELRRRAFAIARGAADAIATFAEPWEPARSLICQSAASLAFRVKEPAEARRLALLGLAGRPSAEVLDNLQFLIRTAVIPEGPRTADGQPVAEGSVVYRWTETHDRVVPLTVFLQARARTEDDRVDVSVASCLSTEAAAALAVGMQVP